MIFVAMHSTDSTDLGARSHRSHFEPPRLDRIEPSRSVGFTLSTIGYAVSQRFTELLAPLGVSPRDFAMLRAVGAREGQTQQAVGEHLHIPPSRMVAIVDALEGQGLLERRLNPSDRRMRALHLTEEGQGLLARAFAEAVAHEQSLCAELGQDQREQLLELLSQVGASLDLPPGVHAAMGDSELPQE